MTNEEISKTGDVETYHPEDSDLTPDKTVEEMKKWIKSQFDKGEKKSWHEIWTLFENEYHIKNNIKFTKALDELKEEGVFGTKNIDTDNRDSKIELIYVGD